MSNLYSPKINVVSGEQHRSLLREAYIHAWKKSDDPKTKTGAIIVSPDLEEFLASGTNHLPRGLTATPEQMQDRDWKYKHIIHAEPAAIFSAARIGMSTQGAVMYMPWVPCTPCATAIIDSGIKTLIGHKGMIMKTPERWWDSLNYALLLLKQAGVETLMYEEKLNYVGLKGLFDGEEWEP